MGDNFQKFKAAAIQAAPVFLNRDASIQEACNLIKKASNKGAKLIALPEAYIPGYPHWVWLMGIEESLKYCVELFKN